MRLGGHNDPADQAGRQWDAFLERSSGENADPAADFAATIAQLHARDDAPAIDPAFADRLYARLITGPAADPATAPSMAQQQEGNRVEQTALNSESRPRRTRPIMHRPVRNPVGRVQDIAPHRGIRPWSAIPVTLVVLIIIIGTLLIGRSPNLFEAKQFAAGTLDATPTATVTVSTPEPPSAPIANPSGSRGGSTRTGVMPGPAPSGVPSIAWTRPDIQMSGSELTTDGDRLYVTRSNADQSTFSMAAIDLASGADLWSIEVENGSWFVPVANDDYVFFPRNSSSTAFGELLALDRDDGSVAWSYPVEGGLDSGIDGVSPALADGLVYITALDQTLRAIDAKTGAEVWRAALYETAPQQQDGIGGGSVAVADGTVFAAGAGGMLFAFDAKDGSPRWSYQAEGRINRSPVVSGGVVFVSSLVFAEGPAGTPGRLDALDAQTGMPIWETKIIGSSFSLTASNDTLFVAGSTPDGAPLEALDARTGELRWTDPDIGYMFAPVVVDGMLVVDHADGAIVGLDTATGDMTWSVYLGRVSEPVVVDGLLVAGSYTGLNAVKGNGGANSTKPVDLSGLPACEPPRAYPRAELEGTPAATIEQETRLEKREGRPPTWEDGRVAYFTEWPQLLRSNLPVSAAVSPDAVSGIQQTLRAMAKCSVRPEGDPQIQGFFSEDFFRRGVALTRPDGYMLTWQIQPEETEIASLSAFVLEDGRIAAEIAPIHNPGELIIFVQQDGHWLIDECYIVVDEYNFGPLG